MKRAIQRDSNPQGSGERRKKDIKKLKLNLERLRSLEPTVLASVKGGQAPSDPMSNLSAGCR